MRAMLKALAYKWCKEYGDVKHHREHHGQGLNKCFSMFCANCTDGLSYAEEVIKLVKKRLS